MLLVLARLALAAVLLLGVAGCSGGESAPTAGPTSGASATGSPATPRPAGTIALLMPGPPRMRSEAFDRHTFVAAVGDRCSDCRVDFYDARGDAGTQSDQLAQAVSGGARIVVLDAVEPLTMVNQVAAAQERGVKVVGYDTLLEGLDYYVAYDRDRIGELQARALVRAVGRSGTVLMVNGSPADPGALQVKTAVHRVVDHSGTTVVGEYDALPDQPRATRDWLSTMFTFFPPGVLSGVYAADDTVAGTVVHALPADAPPVPVTGAGATLAGVKRLVAGRQLMTVYRPVRPAADTAARIAVAALAGDDPGQPTTTLNGVPTYLLEPVPVTVDNLERTVVADGFWTVGEICTRRLERDCARAGLR